MIYLDKMKEDDLKFIFKWKKEEQYLNRSFTEINDITMESLKRWFNDIKDNESCLHWIIQSGAIKIGIADINHIDFKNRKCKLECIIADIHFKSRGLKPIIVYNLYEYAFNELGMNEVCRDVTNASVYDYEKHDIREISITNQRNNHFNSIRYISMNKKMWEKIKGQFSKENIKIS